MITWTRSRRERRCGSCGKTINVGDAVALLSAPSSTWVKSRCVACEGPAPSDLPPLEYEQQRPRHTPPSQLTSTKSITAGGVFIAGRLVYPAEREPGEEG